MSDHDKTLVTLALLAYSQSACVREAIAGAFSQDYSPLEIMLSDDCSSDDTVQIILQMAKEYSGPHSVFCRQNKIHDGICAQMNEPLHAAKGESIVMAVGDEVSVPHRVSLLVGRFG